MERIKYQVRKGYQDNLQIVDLKKGCWQHRLQKRTCGLQTSISKGKTKVYFWPLYASTSDVSSRKNIVYCNDGLDVTRQDGNKETESLRQGDN